MNFIKNPHKEGCICARCEFLQRTKGIPEVPASPVTGPAEKLDALVYAYLEAHGRNIPKFIAMTERDFAALRDHVCRNLPKELFYVPAFFHGIAIVVSRAEKETKCCP